MSSEAPTAQSASVAPPPRRWAHWPTVVVLVLGLVVTGVLTGISASVHSSNEKRLLNLRARDLGSVLTAVLPSIQTPLASAATLADATGGNAASFKRFAASYVGTGGTRPFVSVSLWDPRNPQRGPVASVGAPPQLASSMGRAPELFSRALRTPSLSVAGLLASRTPRLGYAYVGGPGRRFAAYGESALPPSRHAPAQQSSAFTDLDYALYLGPSTKPASLLITNVRHLPLSGTRAIQRVPFGDTFLTVSVAARGPLAGSLPQRLPLIIAIVGTLLTLGAALLTARLSDRRRHAERLAGRLEKIADENQRLYAEQRGIAQTLQHALLPDALLQMPGLEARARYEVSGDSVEIGGDWYDLIKVDDRQLLLVVGDVSGRGLRAAATMASLRYAILAYAAQGDLPDAFLAKLSKLITVKTTGHIATILCVQIDVPERRVSVTSAGHLPPLMISGDGSEFVRTEVGLPVGVDGHPSYTSTTVSAPPQATLLAFTDGLVERRDETIDTGLERLRQQAGSNHVPLEELLASVIKGTRDEGSADDTAIAGIRWLS